MKQVVEVQQQVYTRAHSNVAISYRKYSDITVRVVSFMLLMPSPDSEASPCRPACSYPSKALLGPSRSPCLVPSQAGQGRHSRSVAFAAKVRQCSAVSRWENRGYIVDNRARLFVGGLEVVAIGKALRTSNLPDAEDPVLLRVDCVSMLHDSGLA